MGNWRVLLQVFFFWAGDSGIIKGLVRDDSGISEGLVRDYRFPPLMPLKGLSKPAMITMKAWVIPSFGGKKPYKMGPFCPSLKMEWHGAPINGFIKWVNWGYFAPIISEVIYITLLVTGDFGPGSLPYFEGWNPPWSHGNGGVPLDWGGTPVTVRSWKSQQHFTGLIVAENCLALWWKNLVHLVQYGGVCSGHWSENQWLEDEQLLLGRAKTGLFVRG